MIKPNILIATPTVNGVVTTVYLHTINKLLKCKDFDITVETLDTSELFRARSYFAGKFIQSTQYTHLLFVDSDVGFNSILIEKLISFNKPFVGAICPKRYFNKEDKLEFVCADKIIKTVDNFAQMSKIGTGILLITPEVIKNISKRFPQLDSSENLDYFTSKGLTGKVNQCFAPVADVAGNYLSEDLSFCYRWTECGGEIWACTDEQITHVGAKEFTGTFKE